MGEFQPVKIEKPWGHEILWAKSDRYVGKIISIHRGASLSLQYHRLKDETIYVLKGVLLFQSGPSEERLLEERLTPGQARHIPAGLVHRMSAEEDCELLEASTTELDDVVRIRDDYGRADV